MCLSRDRHRVVTTNVHCDRLQTGINCDCKLPNDPLTEMWLSIDRHRVVTSTVQNDRLQSGINSDCKLPNDPSTKMWPSVGRHRVVTTNDYHRYFAPFFCSVGRVPMAHGQWRVRSPWICLTYLKFLSAFWKYEASEFQTVPVFA